MIPSGVCDLVDCGAGCFGPWTFRKVHSDPGGGKGGGGAEPWTFKKSESRLLQIGIDHDSLALFDLHLHLRQKVSSRPVCVCEGAPWRSLSAQGAPREAGGRGCWGLV